MVHAHTDISTHEQLYAVGDKSAIKWHHRLWGLHLVQISIIIVKIIETAHRISTTCTALQHMQTCTWAVHNYRPGLVWFTAPTGTARRPRSCHEETETARKATNKPCAIPILAFARSLFVHLRRAVEPFKGLVCVSHHHSVTAPSNSCDGTRHYPWTGFTMSRIWKSLQEAI